MEDNELLVIEYLPSKNTKRFKNSDEALVNHMNLIENLSDKSRSSIKCELNISYGDGPREKYDLYHNDLPPNSPIFIYIHGGYWQEVNKDQSAFSVLPLCNAGYKVIILGYELCPKITLENLIKQIQKGIQHILNYAKNIDCKNLSIAGHSAGAHLAAFLIDNDFLSKTIHVDLIKNIYLISGVYDLRTLRTLNCVNLNNILSLTEDTAIKLSPLNLNFSNLKNFNISIHIYVPEYESKTFIKQSKEMYEVLKKIDTKIVTFNAIKESDHFDIVEKLSENDYILTKFIISNL